LRRAEYRWRLSWVLGTLVTIQHTHSKTG
jgi:hypothetical protein